MRNWSVPATPTGWLKASVSWPLLAQNSSVLVVQYSCMETVALALSAAAASSSVVPPSYMRNSPSVGVSHTSDASHSMVYSMPIRSKMRLISRWLPTV
ncbi:MAG: hypothetical protein OZX49_00625 [Immundisolibacter sp.]|nr:hypothetical protein [Immundisolibacter sp.]